MSESTDSGTNEDFKNDDQDVTALLKKMQRRLDSIEEKIDSLIRTSKSKPFSGNSFSEPRRDFDKTRGPKDRKYSRKKEEVSSEGKFYHGRPFGKKKDSGSKGPFTKSRRPAGRPSK